MKRSFFLFVFILYFAICFIGAIFAAVDNPVDVSVIEGDISTLQGQTNYYIYRDGHLIWTGTQNAGTNDIDNVLNLTVLNNVIQGSGHTTTGDRMGIFGTGHFNNTSNGFNQGLYGTVTGLNAAVFNEGNAANGPNSFVINYQNIVGGEASFGFGILGNIGGSFSAGGGNDYNILGDYSWGFGYSPDALHDHTAVWDLDPDSDYPSTTTKQFSVLAPNGIRFKGATLTFNETNIFENFVYTNDPRRVNLADAGRETETGQTFTARQFITKDEAGKMISETVNVSLYGATNDHPVLSGHGSLEAVLPGTEWVITNALADGVWTLIGAWSDTNAVDGVINAATRTLKWDAYTTGIGNPTVSNYVEYVSVATNYTTNVLATTKTIEVPTVLTPLSLSAHMQSNQTCTVTCYQTVLLWVRRDGGVSANYIIRGGTDQYDAHMLGPSISGTFQPYSDELTTVAANGSDHYLNGANFSNMVFNMNELHRWQTDTTNYVEFGGLSATQMVMRFVVDGVVSNTYFNMVSD